MKERSVPMPTSLKAVTHAQNIRYDKAAEALYIIDQSLLPNEERELRLQSVEEMVEAKIGRAHV